MSVVSEARVKKIAMHKARVKPLSVSSTSRHPNAAIQDITENKVSKVAHQLKGTFAYICAERAQQAALRLEKSGKALAAAVESTGPDAPPPENLLKEVDLAMSCLGEEMMQVEAAVSDALQSFS